jgi:hypothetical protein
MKIHVVIVGRVTATAFIRVSTNASAILGEKMTLKALMLVNFATKPSIFASIIHAEMMAPVYCWV